ncbi:MAG TPA: carbon-nitrogen hydrolase family protein [Candidatus Agrococcus pullicola]|uniref:Carbon-nitrogen hydrolase family protein n=1 Tax=Candidatus Agrococcus pullicola TaxID=2838429 RepID=A0A9D1YTP1_9MICO|nr:carbon-nitrogen hydrolase family protein [Candidatus Agrococcus pullicola]
MTYALEIALLQLQSGPDPEANLGRMRELAIGQADADLIVFPEYSHFLEKDMRVSGPAAAEPLDGPFVQGVSALSQDCGATIIAGMLERDGDRVLNTLIVCSDGRLQATYRKVHLYDSYGGGESTWLAPGDAAQLPVIDVAGAPVGLQTCYDLRFPESTRRLASAGAEIVVVPADWVPGPLKEYQWRTLLAARAIENTVYVAAVDVSPPLGVGHSTVFDPRGIAVAGAGDEAEVVVRARLRSQVVAQARDVNPSLALGRYRVTTTLSQEGPI